MAAKLTPDQIFQEAAASDRDELIETFREKPEALNRFAAGVQGVPVTITGSGLGTNPTISIDGQGVSAVLDPDMPAPTDSTIYAIFNVASNPGPTENVTVALAMTNYQSFLSQQTQQKNNSKQITVVSGVTIKLEFANPSNPTIINRGTNYSEDTAIKVTAVDPNGATRTDFNGAVSVQEDGSTIYTQNTALGANLPSLVTLTNGTSQFLAKSLAGPAVEASPTAGGSPPNPAKITTTNYPVYQGAELLIPQWISSGNQIDKNADQTAVTNKQVFDWVQARAADVFSSATGAVASVLGAVSSYTLSGIANSGGHTDFKRAAQSPITLNPYSTAFRLDTGGGSTCNCTTSKWFTQTLLHEARHAYQASQGAVAGNDTDGDFLVRTITLAPTTVFIDSTAVRTVCDEFGNNGSGKPDQKAYLGDAPGLADLPADADLAWELDAWAFASNHIPGSAAPASLTATSVHTGNFTQGQLGAQYTITISNQAGRGSTSGEVTVYDAVDSGLTLVSMTGSGWTCTSGSPICTRSDALPGGVSFPPITVTVNVAADAPSTQRNTVNFSGGGSISLPSYGSEITTINPR